MTDSKEPDKPSDEPIVLENEVGSTGFDPLAFAVAAGVCAIIVLITWWLA